MNKIAFSVQGEGWDALINQKFGRADGFALYDPENDILTYHSNTTNLNAEHGVGIQTAQFVVSLGANTVVTGGNVGPKATEVLKHAGIKIIEFAGEVTVKEAYNKFFGNNK
jgi:predicted Fe-Mo cluster-binding NifX family protein